MFGSLFIYLYTRAFCHSVVDLAATCCKTLEEKERQQQVDLRSTYNRKEADRLLLLNLSSKEKLNLNKVYS